VPGRSDRVFGEEIEMKLNVANARDLLTPHAQDIDGLIDEALGKYCAEQHDKGTPVSDVDIMTALVYSMNAYVRTSARNAGIDVEEVMRSNTSMLGYRVLDKLRELIVVDEETALHLMLVCAHIAYAGVSGVTALVRKRNSNT
jgi:hypothetical protein